MTRLSRVRGAASLLALCLLPSPSWALPWADQVVGYAPGAGITAGFDDPARALGMPSQNNGFSEFGGEIFDAGDVTPFNPAFRSDQLVQVGAGGELVVRFDAPVTDDPLNPFGLDLLVFGNAFFFQPDLFGPIAEQIEADDALISVSQDGVLWRDVASVFADALFPTSGFLDTPSAYESGGIQPADFTRPVYPRIRWQDQDYDEIIRLYRGSGGGGGVDLAEVGLPWIQYVRIRSQGGVVAEIDAFSDVAPLPEPGGAALLGLGIAALSALRGRA
jgi:hypothetical protein